MNLTNLVMDLILMALLIAALLFGMRLHRNLKVLRAGQEAFAKAVHELDSAAIRAHASLKELRSDADESQELLHGRIVAARDLMQKLDLQVARAECVQKDLESGVATAVALQSVRAQPVQAAAPADRAPVTPGARRPFDRDMVREPVKAPNRDTSREISREPGRDAVPQRLRASVLPDLQPEDDSEIMDKVQMSELVVANLNEMIRSLNMPRRRALSVEDELFGGDDSAA